MSQITFQDLESVTTYYQSRRLPTGITDTDVDEILQTLTHRAGLIIQKLVENGFPACGDLKELEIPRLDGGGNLKPGGVAQAVRDTAWQLFWAAKRLAERKEKAAAMQDCLCPHCHRPITVTFKIEEVA